MAFKIVRNDITKMNTEAIVNTANEYPVVGSGCDSAVYDAAGHDELLAYRREKIGIVPEGEAFITPGFRLQAKYIIHAVSPLYMGGREGEEEKLRSCYRNSLRLAKENGIRSVAFPLISTGGFGYPEEEGMRIAVDEIHAFLLTEEMDIILAVFGDRAKTLGKRIFPGLEEYIDQNYVENKRLEEYGGGFAGRTDADLTVASPLSGIPEAERRERRRRDIRKNDPAAGAGAPSVKTGSAGSSRRKSLFRKEKKETARPSEEPSFMMDALYAPSVNKDEDELPDFEARHESRLEERMRHLSDTFSQYLMYLIRDKNLKNADVYRRAIVDKKIFSKIKNNVDYHPQKRTALCLCIGAMLNMDESRDLLARAGYALSPCDKTDIIFSYFIENQIYDMIELDIQLEEHGLPCIIT